MKTKENQDMRQLKKENKTVILKSNERGITLIALVITIIVLLILSAVTIATLTGENGILTQTQKAEVNTRGGTVQEIVDLWKIEQRMSENQEDVKDVNQLVEEMVANGQLIETEKDEIIGNTEKGIEATGQVTIGDKTIVFFEIEPYKIGDYVEYNLDYDNDDNILDDWRLFYKDDNNIYLIATDYVAIDGVTEDLANDGRHIIQLNKQEGVTNVDTAIQYLQNTSYWTGLFGNNMAEYAIGGTTIELFVNSWNKKYPDKKIYLAYTEKGVNAGFEENPTTVNTFGGGDDDLYYLIKGGKTNSTQGMWLSSKSGDYGYLIRTQNSGAGTLQGSLNNLNGELPTNGEYRFIGLRPIICLKQNVNLIYEEGTIENPHRLELNN